MGWKKILIAASLIVVVLLVAIYAFLSLYDFNKFKPMLTQAVKEATGRELTLDGDITIELGLTPTILLEDVSFQNASWGSRPDLAKVKRMEIQVALLPLIRGDFEFVRLVTEEPVVIIETDSSGTSNFEFKTSDEQETTLPILIFQDVHIEKGLLTYKDGQSGDTYTVRFDHLKAHIPGLDKSMKLDFEGAFDDIPVSLKGTVGPIVAWIKSGHSWPTELTVRVGGASFNVKGEIRDPVHFKDLAFAVTGEGPSISDFVKLAGVSDMPELGAFGLEVKLADPEGKLALEVLDFDVGSEELADISLNGTIKDLLALQGISLNFAVQGKDSAKLTQFGLPLPPVRGFYSASGRIFDPEVSVYAVSDLRVALGENEITGRVDLNLTAKPPYLTAKLTSKKFALGPFNLAAKLTGPTDKLALEKMDLQIGTEDLAVMRLNGSVKNLLKLDGVNLSFRVHGKDLANLKKLSGRPLPVSGAFSASGQVIVRVHKDFKIPKLKITVGKNHIAGSLDLDLRSQRPRLSALLSSKKFDLTSLLTPEIAKLNWVKALGDLKTFRLAVKLSGFAKELTVEDMDFRAGTRKLAEVTLKGSIKDLWALRGIDLNVAVQGENVANLEKSIGLPLPVEGAFALSGQIADPGVKNYRVSDLKLILGDNDGSGSMELNLANQRPKVTVAMSSQKIDLRPLLAKAEKKDTKKGPPAKSDKTKDKVFSSKPWSLDRLKRVDADMKIRDKQVLVPHLALDDITADILLNNGNLTVEPIKFVIGGGSVNGRFNLRSQDKPSSVKVELKIDQIDLGPMLDELGYQRTLGGTLNADIMLAGSGNSLADLMADLNGRIYVGMKDGQVASEYLYVLQDILGTEVLRLINPFKKNETQTKVNCSVNVINIKDGLAECKLLLDTDQTSIFCVGDVDLRTENLDLKVKPVPKKGYGLDSVVKIGFSFNALSKPFRLGGTLAHPSLVLDTAGTVFTLGKLAGAVALGPIGITAFFADVSLGKKDTCLEALKAFEKEDKVKSGEKPEEKNKTDKEPDDNKTGTGKEEGKKSTGFFRKLFHRENKP